MALELVALVCCGERVIFSALLIQCTYFRHGNFSDRNMLALLEKKWRDNEVKYIEQWKRVFITRRFTFHWILSLTHASNRFYSGKLYFRAPFTQFALKAPPTLIPVLWLGLRRVAALIPMKAPRIGFQRCKGCMVTFHYSALIARLHTLLVWPKRFMTSKIAVSQLLFSQNSWSRLFLFVFASTIFPFPVYLSLGLL